MRPRNAPKESLNSNSVPDDDDDDFEATPTNFTPTRPVPRRKTVVPKSKKGNKENRPRSSILHDGQTLKVQERANINSRDMLERQRQRLSHCISHSSCHIVHYLTNLTQGSQSYLWQRQSLNTPVLSIIRDLKIQRTYHGFSRRATAATWHPAHPSVAAVGSKGGDIIVWNHETQGNKPAVFIEGTGANGSIQALKFSGVDTNLLYSASINGQLKCDDANRGQVHKVLLDTGYCDHWFTSLDLSVSGDLVAVGDNFGYVTLLSSEGQLQVWKERLHKMKVTHIEFCPRMPWCLVTASVDRSLKVWDVRNMKTANTFLYSHLHDKPINSAHFSRVDGSRLLTTDQHSEIRVYSCPSFTHSITIPHPHRHFQHLTPIKATWHPLRDIIVVGRYPDPLFPHSSECSSPYSADKKPFSGKPQGGREARTIDLYDGVTGQLLHQLSDPASANKIVSLNLFNPSGDTLLSAAGIGVWVWKPKFKQEPSANKKSDKGKANHNSHSDDSSSSSDDDDDDDTKGAALKRKRSSADKKKTESWMKFMVKK
ncbi:hypothetical protein Pcinc_004258 [Petrolisthes cinctipes]|uniref:DNA damage-binding protein 2 n=1 Tax=Petrolisthes cinctipes TaxID=88211 RepID=A0AAE1GLS1_PETCI|nr:hypothetical protein Pcinc_004258 [Petrolisthes cinctipes]